MSNSRAKPHVDLTRQFFDVLPFLGNSTLPIGTLGLLLGAFPADQAGLQSLIWTEPMEVDMSPSEDGLQKPSIRGDVLKE